MTPPASSAFAPSQRPQHAFRRARLLVSVRDAGEAGAAVAGGADIVDVKDPDRGALGRAAPDAWAAIAAVLPADVPLSLALGELREWSSGTPIPPIPSTVRWLKLGLAGAAGLPDWRAAWSDVRTRMAAAARPVAIGWVAVAYADAEAACAPSLEAVAEAAVETGCAGFLVDTWSKQGVSLTQLDVACRVQAVLPQLRRHGLFTAVAGSLRPSDLAEVAGWGGDIVAVRTAACEGGVRTGRVTEGCVRSLRQRLGASGVPITANPSAPRPRA